MALTDAQKAKLRAKYGTNVAMHPTAIGTAQEATGGSWYLQADADETERWARNWPGSKLRERRFWAQFDRHGNLVDMIDGFEDLSADELNAWSTDLADVVLQEPDLEPLYRQSLEALRR